VNCSCELGFKFRIHEWHRVCQPLTPPPDAPLVLTLDPSFTANGKSSDASAIGIGLLDETDTLNIYDCSQGKYKGMALPDAVVDSVEKWHPATLRIEQSPFFDLLTDAIKLRAELRQVEIGAITPFKPISSKKDRISRLQYLLEQDPPLIRINSGEFVSELLKQAESFCFQDVQNHRRPDNLLDVVCMQAGFC